MLQRIKILNSKLLAPRISGAIVRKDLQNMQTVFFKKRITIVSAGPGYGKTTLIAQTVADLDAVWYRLDSSDRDLFVFLSYLITGIKQYYPLFGEGTMAHLTKAQSLGIEWEAVLRSCLQEMESIVTRELIIVFDDFHFVHDVREIKNSIQFLIEYLPRNIHLVLISRHPVPLSLSRLRALQMVHDINALSLMFGKEEIDQLFIETFQLHLRPDQIETLHQKTNGWVSGLILFYHSLGGREVEHIQTQLDLLRGSEEIITEYMDENFYESLDDEFKLFLMKTSILSHMNSDLCDRLLSAKNSHTMLEKLSKDHLFTFCLDGENREYCYHHLFQDYLRQKLDQALAPDQVNKLHGKTAKIFEEAGEKEAAVRHYIHAKNFTDACRLLSSFSDRLIKQARLQLIDEYLNGIPEKYMEQDPWIIYLRSSAHNLYGRFRDAMDDLAMALGLFKRMGCDEGVNKCLADMGIRFYLTGDFIKAEKVFTQLTQNARLEPLARLETMGHLIFISSYLGKFDVADQLMDKADFHLLAIKDFAAREESKSWLLICRGFRHWASGDLALAVEMGEKGGKGLARFNNYRLMPVYHQLMAMLFYHQGRFKKGLEEANKGLRLSKEKGVKNTSFGWLLCYAGANSISLGHIDKAILYGEKCLEIFEYLESPWGQGTGFNVLQKAYLAAGDFGRSEKMGRKGLKSIRGVNLPLIIGSIKGSLAEVLVKTGKLTEAKKLITESETLLSYSTLYDSWVAELYAQLFIQKGEEKNAREKLDICLRGIKENGYEHWCIGDKTWMVPQLVHIYARDQHRTLIQEIIDNMGESVITVIRGLEKDSNLKIVRAVKTICTLIPKTPPPGLRVCCLGRFRLFRGDTEISPENWKSKKAKTLLKLLIYYRPRGYVSKEIFMEHLWPEEDPGKTTKRFHVALAAIRKVLEPGIKRGVPSAYIKSDLDMYHLHLGGKGYVDADMLEDVNEFTPGGKKSAEVLERLHRAVLSYKGDYFMENLHEEWCYEERERLKAVYLTLLIDMMEHYEALGKYPQAIEYCRRYLKTDMYAENIYQHLMRYYAFTGNNGMIRKTYARCCESIEQGLGVPLSRETNLLLNELISR